MAELLRDEPLVSSAFFIERGLNMFDLSLSNLLTIFFVFVPIAVVITGLVFGTLYVIYNFVKDIISHPHHRGAH